MRRVSSRQNDAVRAFRALAREPDSNGARLLLDGVHLVRDAHRAGIDFELVVVAASRLDAATEEQHLVGTLERDGVDVAVAPDSVFDAISPVRSPSGLAAIARRHVVTVADICQRTGGFVLAAVDVQDPGNLGALLRSAEAGGVTGMLVCANGQSGAANPFSWKAVRGSMGSVLRLPVAAGVRAEDAVEALRSSGARLIAAVPRGGADPDALDWRGHVGLVVGGEGPGLPGHLADRCDEHVTLPMAPAVESLNVAVAGGILVYAARRQRGSDLR